MKRLPHKKYEALVARYYKHTAAASQIWNEIVQLSVRCLSPEVKARAEGDWRGVTNQAMKFNNPIEDLDTYIAGRIAQTWAEDNCEETLPEDLMETLEDFLDYIRTDEDSPCCEYPEEDE